MAFTKLDMSKLQPIPANPNDLNTASAALSNATHLNTQMAKGKLDMSKLQPIGSQSADTSGASKPNIGNPDAPFQPSPTDNPLQAGAKAVGNLPSSFMNFVKGLGSALIHPINTVKGIAETVVGGVSELGRKLGTGANVGQPTTEEEQTFEAFKQALIDRYGSIDKAQKTFETDPFGAGADVMSLLEGGGALAGKTDLLHSYVSKIGGPAADAISKAGDVAGINKIIDSAKNSKVVAPFGGSFKPETAAAFEKSGIKAPVSALTENKFLQGAEGLLSKSPFGAKINEIVTGSLKELDDRTNSVVESLTPKKTLSESALGEQIQKGLKDYEENFKLTEGKIYDEFSKTYGSSNTYAMKTKDALATIIDQQGKDFFKGADPRLSKMYSKLTGENNPEIRDLESQINKIKGENPNAQTITPLEKQLADKKAQLDKDLTFDEIKSTRTSVGEQLSREPDNTALKRLYGALSEDLKAAISKTAENKNATPFGDEGQVAAKAAQDALDQLNKGYATGKQKIEGQIAQSIRQSKPENIAQNLIKSNDPKFYSQVKEMVGEEKFNEVRKYFVRDLFENSLKNGKFNIDKFKSNLADYDKETLDSVLTPEQNDKIQGAISAIENNQKLSDIIKSGRKITEGSQTAALQQVARIGGETGAMITSLLTGNIWAAGAIGLGLIGESLATRLFTSNFGIKLLTEGLSPRNLKVLEGMNLSAPQMAGITEVLKYTPQPQE